MTPEIDAFVTAADNLVNALNTKIASLTDEGTTPERAAAENVRLLNCYDAYDRARMAVVGDINDNEPEEPHNPL